MAPLFPTCSLVKVPFYSPNSWEELSKGALMRPSVEGSLRGHRAGQKRVENGLREEEKENRKYF